ncbi:helix-turn-helix domain-containing protein [Streptomyces sp. NPDC088762]|uniref:helix-turn-helix domain-containing protein n=1 Tax=Streptomyces sp. NPDC088762 TaxID=3365891 RepID=UPI0037F5FC1A
MTTVDYKHTPEQFRTGAALLRNDYRSHVRYDLSPQAYRVLFYLTSGQYPSSPGESATGSQCTIADELGTTPATVSKALKELRTAGIVREERSGWRINPNYMFGGYRGDVTVLALPVVV